MKLISSIEQLRELQTSIRQKKLGYLTNFYIDEFKHNTWISEGDLFYELYGSVVFFIKRSQTFWNVFYSCTAIDSLCESLCHLKKQNPNVEFILDIVGRDIQCNQIVPKLLNIGCKETISLVRMSKITEKINYLEDSNINCPNKNEVKKVYEYLYEYFDKKTEQLPYLKELQSYANEGHIFIYKKEGYIAGFLIYEMNATTSYLRYWFTHPNYRDKKIGSKLLRHFFKIGENTKRQIFWVIQNNENAIKRYRHYGFKEENMFDYVLTL